MKREQRLNCKPIISALYDQGFTGTGVLPPGILKKNTLLKTSMPLSGTIIMCYFPIQRQQQGSISSFALRNYYKEMIIRMKSALKGAGSPFKDLTKREVYLFSNSSLPEKELARECGLGFAGRNTLLINRTWGSRGLLAGMILPLDTEPDTPSNILSP